MDETRINTEQPPERRNSYDPNLEALLNPNHSPHIRCILEQVKNGLDIDLAHSQMMSILIETAAKDQKTGLDLGEAATIKLIRLMEYSKAKDTPLTVIYLDADHFKRINDEINHKTGDKVIQAIAQAIQDTTRATDIQARLNEEPEQKDTPYNEKQQARMGGDEFLIVLPKANPAQAGIVLDRFKEKFSSLMESDVPEYQAAFSSTLTVSAGIIQYDPNQDQSPADLILRAEMAMKQSKQTGNKITVAAIS